LGRLKFASTRTCKKDWVDELGLGDDVESDGDESDEDLLCNQLCTFVITQKEFMNQHWYHCHTCRMVDGVGVCSVCAKVCHRDHDVTYAKFGSFFCDCGAKEDSTCQALVRRPPQPEEDNSSRSRDNVSARRLPRTTVDQALLQQLGFGGTAAMSYVPYRGDLDGSDARFGDLA
ncbi:Purity of essence protein, partial [Daphnia magna]